MDPDTALYERRGLLTKPPRRGSGYCEFPDDAVRVVRFIKRAQDLGVECPIIEAFDTGAAS